MKGLTSSTHLFLPNTGLEKLRQSSTTIRRSKRGLREALVKGLMSQTLLLLPNTDLEKIRQSSTIIRRSKRGLNGLVKFEDLLAQMPIIVSKIPKLTIY